MKTARANVATKENSVRNLNYYKYFEHQVYSGRSFYCLSEDCPWVLWDFVYKVCKENFYDSYPNEWVLWVLHMAFVELATKRMDNDVAADICNADLYAWLNNSYADDYIQEALSNGLVDMQKLSVWEMIRAGQWSAKNRIYIEVDKFLDERHRELKANADRQG